ncbi:hypothetical protein [Micromonospora sp. NPDC004551]|uniref:hypothetical protein n=1 Tax=Micromonospora sp. NPDC004551 TaxID=3154284 RepID=UPI0033A94BF3
MARRLAASVVLLAVLAQPTLLVDTQGADAVAPPVVLVGGVDVNLGDDCRLGLGVAQGFRPVERPEPARR